MLSRGYLGNLQNPLCCKVMEETEMPERVEALLQNTLAHITQMGCSKETRRRMKQRLHRRLDLLVKGDRDEYDRHLERFHQMLEESRAQLGPSKRTLMREVQDPPRRYHLDLAVDFDYGYNGYAAQPNYAFFQTQPLMRPGHHLSYPNYIEAGYREDPIPGWNPWSTDIYGAWEVPPGPSIAPRRSRSVPRSSLRPAPAFQPMNGQNYGASAYRGSYGSTAGSFAPVQVCEAAVAAADARRSLALPPSFQEYAVPEPKPEVPKFARAADWLDAGLKESL